MNDYLCHHGVKGQKWGVRRYQNEDGTLTSAGKRRYSSAFRSYGANVILRDVASDPSAEAAKKAYKAVRKTTKKDKSLTKSEKERRIAGSKEQWMRTREKVANELYPLNGEKVNSRIVRASGYKAYSYNQYFNNYGKLKYEKYRSEGDNPIKAKIKSDVVSIANNATLGKMARRERNANIEEAKRRAKNKRR